MPNLKGGKKYRSGKHTDTKSELHEICEGQSIGRVLKHLGDRNVMLYCNDSKERIAHIRGGLSKKKAVIEVGDIVLYSNRGDELGASSNVRADILAKYNHDTHHDLKRVKGVNQRLFLQLERADTATLNKTGGVPDEGFEFDAESDSEEEEEGNEEDLAKKKASKIAEEQKRNEARDTKYTNVEDDDINIADI